MADMQAALEGATVRNAFTGLGTMFGALTPILIQAQVTPSASAIETTLDNLIGKGFDSELLLGGLGDRGSC